MATGDTREIVGHCNVSAKTEKLIRDLVNDYVMPRHKQGIGSFAAHGLNFDFLEIFLESSNSLTGSICSRLFIDGLTCARKTHNNPLREIKCRLAVSWFRW